MKALYALALLLSSTYSHSEVLLSIGAGKNILDHNGTAFERVAVIGYQYVYSDFFFRPEAGYFLDVSGNGKSSVFASPLVGVRAASKIGLTAHIGVGPAYLSEPDSVLGGHFQFDLEGGIGIESEEIYVGMAWKHLSSAGIYQSNQGRDFIMVQMRVLRF